MRFVLPCLLFASVFAFANGDIWDEPFDVHHAVDSKRSIPERSDIAEVVDDFGFTAADAKCLRDALLALDARRLSPYLRARFAPADLAAAYRADDPLAISRKLVCALYGLVWQTEHARGGSVGVFFLPESAVTQTIAHLFPGDAGDLLRRFHSSLRERLEKPATRWTPREENHIVELFLKDRIPRDKLADRLLAFARFAKHTTRWPELVRHFLENGNAYHWRLVLDAVTWHGMSAPPVVAVLAEFAEPRDGVRAKMVAHALQSLARPPCAWDHLDE